jgi:hypothetical protein
LLLAATKSSGGCTVSASGTSASVPSTTATTSVQQVSLTSLAVVIAKGLTVGQKVVFTNIGSTTPGSFKKSECNINLSTDTNTTTGELTKSNSSGTTTFTVVTAGDYLFTITSTGVSVQIQ